MNLPADTGRCLCRLRKPTEITALPGATGLLRRLLGCAYGVRLDTNYYYWPPGWVNNVPGHFTGSAMPMRFADLDGTLIDTFQVVTQMTDESGQSYPFTIDTLLDRALGASEQYGVFTANAHSDGTGTPRGYRHLPRDCGLCDFAWRAADHGQAIARLAGRTQCFIVRFVALG